MKCTKGMLKTAVCGSGVDKTCQAELFNVPQSLKPWMGDNIENYVARDSDKSVNRIVNNFSLIYKINHLFAIDHTKIGISFTL